jgi:hypothetical protein
LGGGYRQAEIRNEKGNEQADDDARQRDGRLSHVFAPRVV